MTAGADAIISQKRLAHRTSFTFGPRKLAVRMEDDRAAVAFEQPYEDIPFETRTFTEKMMALRGAAIFFGLVGCYQGFAYVMLDAGTGALVLSAVQFALAAAAEWGYRRSNVSFTVTDTPGGSIFVIQDRQHDDIMAAISDRRRSVLRSIAGDIDPENPVDFEVEKFTWLRDHAVITEDEFAEKLEALGKLSGRTVPTAPRRLH